jgi:hypothetical protein
VVARSGAAVPVTEPLGSDGLQYMRCEPSHRMTDRDGRAVASFDANCRAWHLKEASSICRCNCPGNKFRPDTPGPAGLTCGKERRAGIQCDHRCKVMSRDISKEVSC